MTELYYLQQNLKQAEYNEARQRRKKLRGINVKVEPDYWHDRVKLIRSQIEAINNKYR